MKILPILFGLRSFNKRFFKEYLEKLDLKLYNIEYKKFKFLGYCEIFSHDEIYNLMFQFKESKIELKMELYIEIRIEGELIKRYTGDIKYIDERMLAMIIKSLLK